MTTPTATIKDRPAACPACGKPMHGKILICEACWFRVNPLDRHKFRQQYTRNPKNPAAWSAIAKKIFRQFGDTGMTTTK